MTILTIENAKDFYRTENTFSENGSTITKEEKESIKECYNYHNNSYEKDNLLYYIACDYDTTVTVIKNILKA